MFSPALVEVNDYSELNEDSEVLLGEKNPNPVNLNE